MSNILIPKQGGGLRGIHDLRELNKQLLAVRFSMHEIRDTAQAVRSGKVAATIDLEKGYYQILLGPNSIPLVGAEVGGRLIAARILPFGLSMAPFTFQICTAFVGRLIREATGARVVVYLDDFCLIHSSIQELRRTLAFTLSLFHRLGLRLSEKSKLEPETKIKFLGLEWDLHMKQVCAPAKKREAYRERIMKMLTLRKTSGFCLQSLIGKLEYLIPTCPMGGFIFARCKDV